MEHFEGYILIPHELLHIIGYRLIGKRCAYRWGDNRVTPLGALSRQEDLTGLLFPFAVSLTIWMFLLSLSSAAYLGALRANPQSPDPFWPALFGGLSVVAGVYVGACAGDLRRAYRLLRQEPLQQAAEPPEQSED